MNQHHFEHHSRKLNTAKLFMWIAILPNLMLPLILWFIISSMNPTLGSSEVIDLRKPALCFGTIFALKLLAGIFFLRWLLTAMKNAALLNPDAKLPTKLRTISSWFIPIFNIVSPYLVLRQLANTVAEERRTALVDNLDWWVTCWVPQVGPINVLITMLVWALLAVPPITIFVIEWIAYPLAGYFMFKYMDLISLEQEKEFGRIEEKALILPKSKEELEEREETLFERIELPRANPDPAETAFRVERPQSKRQN